MAALTTLPRDVPTTLNYYTLDPNSNEPPFRIVSQTPTSEADNADTEPHEVVIRDARGREKSDGLSLDTSGFQFAHHVSQERDFNDEEKVKTIYYKEIEELLKKETGAKRVFVFDHTIRLKPGALLPEGKLIREPVVRFRALCLHGLRILTGVDLGARARRPSF